MYQQPYTTLNNNNSGFIPTSLANAVLWLDGADSSSMTNDGSGLISQWRDKTSSANHATAATTARPTLTANVKNGRSILRFNGTANVMTLTSNLTLTGEYTRFVVVSTTVVTGNRFYLGHTTTQKEGFTSATPIKYGLRVVSSVDTTQNYPFSANTFGLIWNGRDSSNKVDWAYNDQGTVRLFSDVAQSGDNIISRIGRDEVSNFWSGDIAEVIIYNRRLSTTEVNQVKSYLNQKWALY